MKTKNRWYIALSVTVLMALILACGSDQPTGFGPQTFAKVCSSGEGLEHDAYYGSGGNGEGPYPVMIYRFENGRSWMQVTKAELGSDFPSDWHPSDFELTELVVCLDVIEQEVVLDCTYTANNAEGEESEFVVQYSNTTYEAGLFNAETAEEYSKTTFQSKAEDTCPETAIGRTDIENQVKVIDANPAPELIPFLKPWVEK